MLMKLYSKSRMARRLKGLARKDDGAAAIEFALLAPVFFAMLFSIFEAALFFYRTSVVEEALDRASRKIMTLQQLQAVDPTAPDACTIEKDCFFEEVCRVVRHIGDCDSNLSVEVQEFDRWGDLNSDDAQQQITCANNAGYSYEDMRFDRGTENSIIRVRACFIIGTVSPGIGLKLSRSNGEIALLSSYIFRNEARDPNSL